MYEDDEPFIIEILNLKDADAFIAGNSLDSNTFEQINSVNPLCETSIHSSIARIARIKEKRNVHEIFSNAVKIATPKTILYDLQDEGYSEIILRSDKVEVVGLLVMNDRSMEISKKEAEKLNVPIIIARTLKQNKDDVNAMK